MNLSESARELNVSAAWINKIQKRTDICKDRIGKCGKEPYFDENDIRKLRLVKMLRLLGYSLDKIRRNHFICCDDIDLACFKGIRNRIYDLEREIKYIKVELGKDEFYHKPTKENI